MSDFCKNGVQMTLVGSNPPPGSYSGLDVFAHDAHITRIIPPVVSTPGARPPQGGLC
mgnify:CR=1 FL=1